MDIPVISTSEALAVVTASAAFAKVLAAGERYEYACTVASWIKQGTAPTASAATGSMYVPANRVVPIIGLAGVALAAIRAVGDGTATLTRVTA